MKLADFAQGRDNNFNLVRLVAALAVLFSHSFALVGAPDPLYASLSMTFASIAVDVFFVTSGFLVTASLLTRKGTLEFVWARVLRIYPALVVMVLLVIFVLGLFFTSLSASSFLGSRETQSFVLKNITLAFGIAFTLPGVFESNPFKATVNGSLWTMTAEIRMYAILAMIWLALYVFGRYRERAITFVLVLVAPASLLVYFTMHYSSDAQSDSYRLFYMFYSGAAYFALKEHVALSRRMFFAAIAGLCISALNREIFFVVYNVVLAYALLWLAYVPAGVIRKFNRFGDYSYGVYIYAFPVQQSIAALNRGVSVEAMLLVSSLVTLFLAFVSWHLIEQRALLLKGNPMAVFRRANEMRLIRSMRTFAKKK